MIPKNCLVLEQVNNTSHICHRLRKKGSRERTATGSQVLKTIDNTSIIVIIIITIAQGAVLNIEECDHKTPPTSEILPRQTLTFSTELPHLPEEAHSRSQTYNAF
jgi:hypothetical protein